ncbi:MAG TPA: aminomethyl-transferring glycine dehydrogenase subunit GcvPA [Thermomicrobiales bacterium]|nr:aminomethyl-transferring glycine dehydrogenase subunit GcvPA [Thermomicrobiales bacterium]
MTFNPHTKEDRQAMLAATGIASIEALFGAIPEDVRFPELTLPTPLSEQEAYRRLAELSSRNLNAFDNPSFLGAGSYTHYVPAAVQQITFRGEFYTAYTPYQPEVAQGTLQAIYEYQSMICALTGMEVSNASLYDGATALAEGALLTISLPRKRTRVVIAGTVHPNYVNVVRTYTSGIGVDVVQVPLPADGLKTDPAAFDEYLDDNLACIIVQYPNFFGTIEDIAAIGEKAHSAGANLVVSAYPTALGLLKPPGELGADVVTGEGQPLGNAQSFGGPVVGILATQQRLVRQMPGRLAGIAYDSEGKRGFVLALQTREQHIRREKATSNICTNQGLMALAASVYLSTLGPKGMRRVSEICYQNAHHLAAQLEATGKFKVVNDGEFFNEFTVASDESPAALNRRLQDAKIIGGLDLATIASELDGKLLLCSTEMTGKAAIDRFVEVASAT